MSKKETRIQTDGLRRVTAASCLHVLRRFPKTVQGHCYECQKCGVRLKIASGFTITTQEETER